MTYYEIVKKLIGEINPIGETNVDKIRFENLKVMAELVNELIIAIDNVAYNNKNRHEYSIKKAAEFAEKFLSETIGISD